MKPWGDVCERTSVASAACCERHRVRQSTCQGGTHFADPFLASLIIGILTLSLRRHAPLYMRTENIRLPKPLLVSLPRHKHHQNRSISASISARSLRSMVKRLVSTYAVPAINNCTVFALPNIDNMAITSTVANTTTNMRPFSPSSKLHRRTGARRTATTIPEMRKRVMNELCEVLKMKIFESRETDLFGPWPRLVD